MQPCFNWFIVVVYKEKHHKLWCENFGKNLLKKVEKRC